MAQASSQVPQIKVDDALRTFSSQRTLLRGWYVVNGLLASPWILCTLLFGLALGCNLYRLGEPSVWFDEAFSVELARQPLPLLWHIIFKLEPNMELYYLFLHGWLGLTSMLGFHATEFVVRLPSTIFAALSTSMVFLLGRRFLTLPVGLIGASLYLLNDLQLVYAQQARSYSLQLLLICIAWYTLLSALLGESQQKRWWVCFVGVTTLAVYAHMFSLIIVFAQLCAFVGLLFLPQPWRDKAWRQVRALLVSLVVIGVLIVPLLLVSLQGAKTGWLPVPHVKDVMYLLLAMSGSNKIYCLVLATLCLLGLLGVCFKSHVGADVSRPPPIYRPVGAIHRPLRCPFASALPTSYVLLCWFIVPIVVSYSISQGSIHVFSSRYLVSVVPPLVLLAGMGIAVVPWRTVQVLLALGLLALAVYVVPYYYRSAQVEDWKATAFWLEQQYQAGDGLVCYDNAVQQGCQISIEYYLHAYPSAAHFTADTPGAFSWSTFSSDQPDAAVNPTVLAAYGAKHPRIFFIVGRVPNAGAALRARTAQSWLDSHYRCIAQIVTRTVTIRLYATG